MRIGVATNPAAPMKMAVHGSSAFNLSQVTARSGHRKLRPKKRNRNGVKRDGMYVYGSSPAHTPASAIRRQLRSCPVLDHPHQSRAKQSPRNRGRKLARSEARPMIVWPSETASRPAPTPPINTLRQGVSCPVSSRPKSSRPNQKTTKTVPTLASAVGKRKASSVRPRKEVVKAIV